MEVSTTEPPAQNVVGPPAVIVGAAGVGFTVTFVGADEAEEHPSKVCSTVYEPLVVTVMDGVVSPVDHKFPVEAEEVSTTEPPEQNVVELPAVIVGVAGIGFTVTLITFDAAEEQGPSIMVTE